MFIKLKNRFAIYIRYLISGGTAAFTNVACLFILTDYFRIHYLTSATLSYLIGFIVSFSLQKFWTFRNNDRQRMAGQLVVYFLVAAVNLGVNDLGMYFFVESVKLHYLLAQVVVSGSIAVYSFAVYKIYIFKKSLPVANVQS